MKKILKKFGLSFAALACVVCAGFGVAFSSSEKPQTARAAELTADDHGLVGAGVRLINDANGSGIRFHTNLDPTVYADIVASGTLIIPEVRYDGELTLDDLNNSEQTRPAHIVTKDETVDLWYDATYNNKEYKRATAYLYNIPENSYGARMIAVSYIKYENGDVLYSENSPETSMSDVALYVMNSEYTSEEVKAQVAPYIVDEVTVTYNMPDGSVQTETAAYGAKLSGPTFDKNLYVVSNATDKYGNEVNFAEYEATLSVAIDVELMTKKTVVEQWIKDGYGETASERAWQNGSTATEVTEGIPNGYSSVLRLDWYQDSTSLWKANGNPFYRSCYSQDDISGYDKVTFALKLETSGDACIQVYPKHTSRNNETVVRNEWLGFELVQTSANVWSLTITKLATGEVFYTSDGITRNNSGLNDVDSIASLVFCACKWDNTSTSVMLQPCTTTDMTASVYFTEVNGYNEYDFDPEIPENAEILWNHIWNTYYFTGGGGAEGAYAEDVVAPKGFNYVSEYTWQNKDFAYKTSHFNAADISGYSDLWFAMKSLDTTNAPIYIQGADFYKGGDWLYVHFSQNDDGTWNKEFKSPDGYYNNTAQVNLTATKLTEMLAYGSANTGSYPTGNTSVATTAYFTDVLAIKKDGSAMTAPNPPSYAFKFEPDISEDAVAVRTSPWRDDRYGLSDSTSEPAPEGFNNVVEFNWPDNPKNWAESATNLDVGTIGDTSLDISKYSDLYFATKMIGGNNFYIRGTTAYAGGDWLYAHFSKANNGTWSLSLKSVDGYVANNVQTGIVSTTLSGLLKYHGSTDAEPWNTGFYPTKAADATQALVYYTEVLAVPDVEMEERVIFSAVDNGIRTNDVVGIPAGFNSVFKVNDFTMDQFASMDLSETKFDAIRFGLIFTQNIMINAEYDDFEGYAASNYANIRSTPSAAGQMYTVDLVNNRDGSWTVTMNTTVHFDPVADANGNDLPTQNKPSYTVTVEGNSLSEIMSEFLQNTADTTVYVTEVRGTHTCAPTIISLGNGQLQEVCSFCGKAFADPVDFEHGIDPEATEVNDSIWRDNNYALSTPDQVAPVGFNNIEMYRWNLNSVIVNGVPYGSTAKDMPLTCLDEADISAYEEVWFAMKNVGGTGFYVRGSSKYEGEDWLYFHLVKVDDAWTLSLSSPDGYVAENVQTGIVGNTLKDILQYHASTAEQPWNSGAYPTKADGDTTTDVKIYFTEILGIIGCEHSEFSYVSNGDNTHNKVCESCGKVMEANINCAGGTATCTEAAVCSICNTKYGKALGHQNVTWNWGVSTCGVCGESAGDAAIVAPSAIIDTDKNTHLTPANNEAGVTAPAGFSSVTNFFSASGNTWASKILASADYAQADLSAYKEVWFAIAIQNGHFCNTADNWKNLDADASLVWIKFHMVQTSTDVWTVSIYVADTLYKTFENRPGDTIYELTENNNNGLRLVIYQHTTENLSDQDVNVYATEIMGVFDNGISEYATNVWDHIWDPTYFTGGVNEENGKYSSMAAPEGFSKVSESTWTTGGDFPYYGRFNSSDISAYSDLWFAMKAVGADIFIQGGNAYTGGDWIYVHYHHNSDGTWTKDYRTVDGYFNNTSQVSGNITGTKLTEMIAWKSGVYQGSYPNNAVAGETAIAYFTNVIGVLSCTGEHGADKIVVNGDGTHDVLCRCGTVISDNVACSGGVATCKDGAFCEVCGYEYTDVASHTGGTATCQKGAVCDYCGEVYTDVADHTGGTATCTSGPICTVCGTEYGEKLEHTGGEATCTAQAICSLCGQSYGDKLPHNPVFEDGAIVGNCSVCGEAVLDTGIPTYATTVWDHIWNTYYFTGGGVPEGAYSSMAAPDGFTKTTEYTTSAKDFGGKYGHFNQADISGYSDIWYAMKVVNVTVDGDAYIYLQGADGNGYKGSEWVYVHCHNNGDGTWTKDYRTIDGYYSPATKHNTGITGTMLTEIIGWKQNVMQGSYPTATAGNTYTSYFTEVLGVKACDGTNHSQDDIVANGDGTHDVVCRCGVVINDNVACSGGENTCTEAAVCSICNAVYGSALGHSGAWEGNVYKCETCGETVLTVEETLAKQNVTLFTNASSITANAETPAYITIAENLDLDSVTSVTLNGVNYAATVEGGKIKINVLPKEVFGEYTLKATVVIKGKSFEITAPVLVVTNMITSAQGMLDMKYVLRGKTNEAKVSDTTAQDENVIIYRGGDGGVATMNGDGYYMLGNDIALAQDFGGHTDVYVWGSAKVPFVGTFDGNGHVISNFMKVNWFSGHVLEDPSVTSSYAYELEGSLFGVVNGTVKNVALTNVQLGIYGNIVLDGTGALENVYVEITNSQYNANTYVAPIFWRNGENAHGTLTNVVFNFKNHNSTLLAGATNTVDTDSLSTRYPAAVGKCFTAENVAVYGFNTDYISLKSGRGNVYYTTDTAVDGSAYGVYAEYADGTNNGGTFWEVALDDNIWKIVDGVPYLKNVAVQEGSTVTNPSASPSEGNAEYNFAWNDTVAGAYDAISFIKETTNTAANTELGVIAPSLDFSKKQIIVGTYETYAKYITGAPTNYNGLNYGVYKNQNTIFVLSECEDGFVFAAQEFCRQMFGWNQYTYLAYDENAIQLDSSLTTFDISRISNYGTQIAFAKRDPANDKGLTTVQKNDLGFTPGTPYTYLVSMHNSMNYFGITSSTEEAEHADTAAMAEWSTWDTESYSGITTDYAFADSDNQLCYLAHGDKTTFTAMVEHVAKIIQGKKAAVPTMKTINFMLEDNKGYCTCTACAKFSNPSVTQTIFLNAVANKLLTLGLDVDIEFFSYNAYSPAPIVLATEASALSSLASTLGITYETTTVDYSGLSYASKLSSTSATVLKCADGLRLWWTSHEANHSFTLEHEANAHMYPALLAWIESIGAENVDVFMYQQTYRDYAMPLNTWEYQILWYQSLSALGVNSFMFNLGDVHNNADKQTGFAAFKTYIDSRAMTDVNVTFEELKAEFFGTNGYYGAGGPAMLNYFEELVEVMENHKQGGSAEFVSTADYDTVTTLGTTGNGYVASWLLDYYDVNDNPNYYANHRQAFFNGSYGRGVAANVFGERRNQNANTTLTPDQNVYVHSNYASQQLTLEAWYSYCKEALAAVEGQDAKYAKRIEIEAICPEYLYLVYQSTYKTTMQANSDGSYKSGSVAPTLPTNAAGVFTNTTTENGGNWYQSLYERVVALGVTQPSEFYKFTTYDDIECVSQVETEIPEWMGGGITTGTYRYMYDNFYMNWGVTAA